MISEKMREELASKFDDIIQDDYSLGDFFAEYDPNTRNAVINDVLEGEGYESHVTFENVTVVFLVTSDQDGDDWAERFIDEFSIEDDEDMVSMTRREDNLKEYLCDNPSDLKITVEIEESVEEMKDKLPSVEYFASTISDNFNDNEIAELIEFESPYYQDIKEQRIKEEGIEHWVPRELIETSIIDITLKDTPETLAEEYIEDVEASGGLSNFMKDFNLELVKKNRIDFDIAVHTTMDDIDEDLDGIEDEDY